ncbi:MAG: cell division protein ZapA [Candidatus Faecivicinus sp.]|nr:cell division protein ZapA [Candidatus Faecivicinus sp.]
MKKNVTTVKIAGREYNISGFDSEEEVRRVAALVDRSMNELALTTRLPPAQIAVLAAVNATDRLLRSEDEITRLQAENTRLRALLTDPDPED